MNACSIVMGFELGRMEYGAQLLWVYEVDLPVPVPNHGLTREVFHLMLLVLGNQVKS